MYHCFLDSICKGCHTIFLLLWLTSISMALSRSILARKAVHFYILTFYQQTCSSLMFGLMVCLYSLLGFLDNLTIYDPVCSFPPASFPFFITFISFSCFGVLARTCKMFNRNKQSSYPFLFPSFKENASGIWSSSVLCAFGIYHISD